MATKQVSLRLEKETHEALKLRANLENRNVNAVITDAIEEYSRNHPVSREKMLALVRAIAKEDASLLKALAEV